MMGPCGASGNIGLGLAYLVGLGLIILLALLIVGAFFVWWAIYLNRCCCYSKGAEGNGRNSSEGNDRNSPEDNDSNFLDRCIAMSVTSAIVFTMGLFVCCGDYSDSDLLEVLLGFYWLSTPAMFIVVPGCAIWWMTYCCKCCCYRSAVCSCDAPFCDCCCAPTCACYWHGHEGAEQDDTLDNDIGNTLDNGSSVPISDATIFDAQHVPIDDGSSADESDVQHVPLDGGSSADETDVEEGSIVRLSYVREGTIVRLVFGSIGSIGRLTATR